jgi:hypothetical protein
LMASDISGNHGSALIVRDGDKPRVASNVFARNATDRGATIVVGKASPTFTKNVFVRSTPGSPETLDGVTEAELRRDNWFVAADQPVSRR